MMTTRETKTKTLEVATNAEWLNLYWLGDLLEGVEDFDEDEAAATFASALVEALEDAGFDVVHAKGQRTTCHGWNGFNLFRHKMGPVGTFDDLGDSERDKVWDAIDLAATVFPYAPPVDYWGNQ